MKPRMHVDELRLFSELLSQTTTYLEFGCGGSTLVALRNGVQQLTSVESDIAWIDQLRSNSDISRAETEGRLEFVHAQIGSTGRWGHPTDPYLRSSWPSYSASVWDQIKYSPELILVDGRFRAACVALSLLKAEPQCKIALHDVAEDRPSYLQALQFMDIIASSRTLFVGKRRADVSTDDLSLFYQRQALNPS